MEDIIISGQWLVNAKMTPSDLLIEIAVYLYEKKKLTMGQARKLAKLDQVSFQKEMSKRNVFIQLDIDDIKKDIKNLETGLR